MAGIGAKEMKITGYALTTLAMVCTATATWGGETSSKRVIFYLALVLALVCIAAAFRAARITN